MKYTMPPEKQWVPLKIVTACRVGDRWHDLNEA